MKTTNSVTKETLESLYTILSHLHLEISKDPKYHDNIWTLVRHVEYVACAYDRTRAVGYVLSDFYPDFNWKCIPYKNTCYQCKKYYKGKCLQTETKKSLDGEGLVCDESKVLRGIIEHIEHTNQDYREYDIDRVMELVRIMIDSIVPEVS